MTKSMTMKVVTGAIILAAALISLLFVFVVGGEPGTSKRESSLPMPGIKLASAAQANVMAQTLALDTSTVGIIAHLDLDIDGANPLGLTPGTGDGSFFKTVRDHLVGTGGIGAAIDELGGNYVIAIWCVPNRIGCINVRIYADSAGNVAAYLTRGEPSARVWQAQALDFNNPALTNSNFDTVLVGGPFSVSKGGIKEMLLAIGESLGTLVGGVSLHDQITWFHFGLQGGVIQADRLLMIGKANGQQNSTKTVNFALPEDMRARVLEVSWAFYSAGGASYDGRWLNLDGGRQITLGSYYGGESTAAIIGNLTTFNARAAHSLAVHMANTSGSVGAALMIIYDDPSS